jgi:hypothetical protein
MTYPAPGTAAFPPSANRHRRFTRFPLIALLAALLVGVIVGLSAGYFWGNSSVKTTPAASAKTVVPPTTAPTSAAPSAAASSPATPAAAQPPTCINLTTSGPHYSVTQYYPASSAAAISELTNLKGARFTDVIYAGEFATPDAIAKWVSTAKCSGFASIIKLDTAFSKFAGNDAGLTSYVKSIDTLPGIAGYVVSMNEPTTAPSSGDGIAPGSFNINHEVDLVKLATNKPVKPLVDYVNTVALDDQATGINVTKIYHGDARVPVFEPFGNSYGPVSLYTQVGQLARAVDGDNAWVGIQALAGATGPAPTPTQVAQFAQLVRLGGTKNILVYTEEPKADEVPYLKAIASLINPGTSCVPVS